MYDHLIWTSTFILWRSAGYTINNENSGDYTIMATLWNINLPTFQNSEKKRKMTSMKGMSHCEHSEILINYLRAYSRDKYQKRMAYWSPTPLSHDGLHCCSCSQSIDQSVVRPLRLLQLLRLTYGRVENCLRRGVWKVCSSLRMPIITSNCSSLTCAHTVTQNPHEGFSLIIRYLQLI